MSERVWSRLFDATQAFDHPFTFWFVVSMAVISVVSGLAIVGLGKFGVISRETYTDAFQRWKSWLVISAVLVLPILLGAAWTILGVMLLSLGCFWEFARVTTLRQEKVICSIAMIGICLLAFAAADHYDRLFFACGPIFVGLIVVCTIPQDRPKGYTQRVALGALGFSLFGFSMGYLANLANAPNYRPVLVLLIASVALNDIFAYCTGKAFGRSKIVPNTSPGKTLGGFLGALILTTAFVIFAGHLVFYETALDRWHRLLMLGVLISVLGQLGDLTLSSLKRDVGIKDTGSLIPGHGGLLDRFDSLVLPAPGVYHFLSLYLGPWAEAEPARIITQYWWEL